jgi:hypothetical protein
MEDVTMCKGLIKIVMLLCVVSLAEADIISLPDHEVTPDFLVGDWDGYDYTAWSGSVTSGVVYVVTYQTITNTSGVLDTFRWQGIELEGTGNDNQTFGKRFDIDWWGWDIGDNRYGDFQQIQLDETGSETALYVIKADLDTADLVCWFNPDLSLLEQDQTGLSVTRTNDFITTLDTINYRSGKNTNTYTWSDSKLYTNGDSPFGYVPPTAAMIVNPGDLSSGFDQAQYDRLVSMGYEVNVVAQSDVGSVFTVDDANAVDLLLISESISSSAADPLRGTTTPVMHNEGYGWDNWYLTTGASPGWQSGSDVDIVNDTHPIAVDAGIGAGPLAFYSIGDAWTTDLVSALAPGAELLAQITVDTNDYAIIFTIDEGAELADGNSAPSRIAGFSITGSTTYDANGITEDAWALWDATIHWLNPAPPLLVNGSFELPGTDKIHGFNGENPSDGAYGEYEDNPLPAGPDTNVPGWQTDSESVDSGVQLGSDFNGSTDGDWVAFMRSSNPALWQLTDHVIGADDVIVFSVDASLNWNGKTLQMTIYYDDDGTRVPIASEDHEIQDDWQTFTLTSDVSAVPEAIGKKLGVEVNHSDVADPAYDGWMMFDNAVLEVN